jgi:transcriptional regulator GlxA family with amidase domain
MRCACVPIHFDGHLVGVAKVVGDTAASSSASFSAAVDVLKLVVSDACHNLVVSVLSDEVRALRNQVTEFQQILATAGPPITASGPPIQNARLVHRTLAYLQANYQDPDLSLPIIAVAVGCNPKYLTSCFTLVVGQHMHRYLISLRVARACELLVATPLSIKEIAHAAGFSSAGRLANTFRTRVGVPPKEYRRIFSSR